MNRALITKLVKSCIILRLVLSVYPAIRTAATCSCNGVCSGVIICCSVLGSIQTGKILPGPRTNMLCQAPSSGESLALYSIYFAGAARKCCDAAIPPSTSNYCIEQTADKTSTDTERACKQFWIEAVAVRCWPREEILCSANMPMPQ